MGLRIAGNGSKSGSHCLENIMIAWDGSVTTDGQVIDLPTSGIPLGSANDFNRLTGVEHPVSSKCPASVGRS